MINLQPISKFKQLWCLLLLPVFFLLHGYNENFGLLSLLVVLRLFFFYVLITVGVAAMAVLLLRSPAKATAFSFFLLFLFFFFGAFHDGLRSIAGNRFISSYKFLLPFLFILVVSVFLWLKRTRHQPQRPVLYVRNLLGVLVVFELIIMVYAALSGKAKENNLAGHNAWQQNTACEAEKPDIFFVVFDGYTSSQCLKEEFSYDNSPTDSTFQANHFFVSRSSRSNYNATPFSLSSTFEGQYLKPALEKDKVTSKTFVQAMETFRNNHLLSFLKKLGYGVKNFGCFDLKDAPLKTDPYFKDAYSKQIDDQTLYSRIKRDIGWNFTVKNIFTGASRIPESYRQNKAYHLYRNNYNWQALLKELQTAAEEPRFVYVHLMLPHEPFYLNGEGKEVPDTAVRTLKEAYLEQVKFSNALLKQLIPIAAAKSHRPKVVLIEGDHGFRDYDSVTSRNKEFMNLNAYFFSDQDYNRLYDGISPVNSFRVVLNKYFCLSYPMLRDSSIYLINN